MATQHHSDLSLSAARTRAFFYESGLDPDRRKRLGQFFTGLPLSRVLAALSLSRECTSVTDPMAGHGDLLDAVFERCTLQGVSLRRVDAIEVDPPTACQCRERLQPWDEQERDVALRVHEGSAFDPDLMRSLPSDGYDLVITNPPYVRYQTVAAEERQQEASVEGIRKGLHEIVSDRVPSAERSIWQELVKGYSGLSDFSVPAWLLSGVLVKPGGTLALVAPATWRSRDYADVLQYLLARCFRLETVVADRQPGWFSEALVRTHLVVATRLQTRTLLVPINERKPAKHKVAWAEVDPTAKKGEGLVGAAFDGEDPEGRFAEWLHHGKRGRPAEAAGIALDYRLEEGVLSIGSTQRAASWLRRLEPGFEDAPLFSSGAATPPRKVPYDLEHILHDSRALNLHDPSELGIRVSQGLRTGCNGFFYVEFVETLDSQTALVRVSNLLGGGTAKVPLDALRPVLHQQAEVGQFLLGSPLRGRVLDLRGYVLPEDLPAVEQAHDIYRRLCNEPPRPMPDDLSDLVRRAAKTSLRGGRALRLIPELSAVKTNARTARHRSPPRPPRFWYMLPDFVQRHLPDAFVPRINQDTPRTYANRNPPVIIDANFSTLWSDRRLWTSKGIVGLMNSAWARACMEAIGTPMGGGALKLEATHLRRLPLPELSAGETERIAELAGSIRLSKTAADDAHNEADRIVISAILGRTCVLDQVDQIVEGLCETAKQMQQARQRR